ncbi:MAG: hypothetical protein ABSG69_12385 [Candidatus Acidiferrum sp.]|jgi:hypothetical protein
MNRLTTAMLIAGIAACSLFAPVPACAQDAGQGSSGDSVADAARKARESKKNAAKPAKVYTDEDVSPTPPPATTSQPTEGAPAGTPAAGADAQAGASADAAAGSADAKNPQGGAAPAGKNDEKSWRERFQKQRDQIDHAEKELDVLQREEEKSQVQYYPDPQKALSEQFSRKDINEKDAKIAAKKDEIAKLKQGLDDLEDELRKAGGDPGWAR